MIHLDLDLELRRRREYLFLRCILLRLLCRPCRPCRCRRLVLLLFPRPRLLRLLLLHPEVLPWAYSLSLP